MSSVIGRRTVLGAASFIGGSLALGAVAPAWARGKKGVRDLRDAVAGKRIMYAGTWLHVPFMDRLAYARAAGFDALSIFTEEWRGLMKGGMTPEQFRKQLADAGVTLTDFEGVMNWIPGRVSGASAEWSEQLDRLTGENIFPLAVAAGAPTVLVGDMNPEPVDIDQAVAGFAALCDLAARHGLRVELEFMPFGGIPDLASAWEIVRRADRPNGGLLIDSWHFFRSNSSLDLLAKIPGDKIFAVQLNDAPAKGEADLLEETMHRRRLPGEGDFDLAGLIVALKRTGFPGPYGIESYSDDFAQRGGAEIAQRCATALDRVLKN